MLSGRETVACRGVSLVYESPVETVWAVNDVSFTAHTGEFVVIEGPSGSGKTSLLHCVAGFIVPTTGHIEVDGEVVTAGDDELRARLRLERVGVVFQQDNLVDEFTASENVTFPLELLGWAESEAVNAAADTLALVGVDHLSARYPRELSGGQQQRVGIARALVGGRRLIVADEPSGALDTANSEGLYRLLKALCEEQGVTVLMSSHDQRAHAFAHRIVTMQDGRLVSERRTAA